MPTYRTGTFKVRGRKPGAGRNKSGLNPSDGFTLFELIIVIFIISLTTALIMPSLWVTGEKAVRTEAKRVANTLRYIYDEAAGKKQPYVLTFNIDEGMWRFSSETESRGFEMKDHVMFRDIVVPSLGNVSAGEVIMEFGPLGPAEPVTVHLMKDDSEYTVIFNHLNGRAKIHEGYVVMKAEE